MGVKGLWRLLLPVGRRISLETLEGRVLAVDASIWLTQFVKAMRDPETGKVQPAAHLLGFLRRLCRLYFHGIRPVFVFDGPTPAIKLREIADRRKRREQFAKDDSAVQRLAKRLLAEQLKKKQQVKPPVAKTTATANAMAMAMAMANTSEDSLTLQTGGDFVPGFVLGEDDAAGDDPEGEEKDDTTTTTTTTTTTRAHRQEAAILDPKHRQPVSPVKVAAMTSEADEAAILAAIQQDLLEEEAQARERNVLGQQQQQQRQQHDDNDDGNDFDAPLYNSQEDDHDDNDEDDLDQENYNRNSPQQQINNNSSNNKRYFNTSRRRRRNHGGNQRKGSLGLSSFDPDGVQDLDYIATLPSHERKDAIEEAKRQQRLQSRREYMPAAASPDKFSTVQLQNFLKSSRFNLDIAHMVTEQVMAGNGNHKNNSHSNQDHHQHHHHRRRPDESVAMASDRTTRISLIREGTVRQQNQKQQPQTKANPISWNSRPLDHAQCGKMENDGDASDDEVEWEDSHIATTQTPTTGRSKTRAIMDELGKETDNRESDGFLMTTNGNPPLRTAAKSSVELLIHHSGDNSSQEDNDDEGGRGFLPTDSSDLLPLTERCLGVHGATHDDDNNNNNNSQEHRKQSAPKLISRLPTARSIHRNDEEEEENGGGFFLDKGDERQGFVLATKGDNEQHTKKNSSTAVAKPANLILLNDDNSAGSAAGGGGGFLMDDDHPAESGRNQISHQEEQDRALALALQTAEDAEMAQRIARASFSPTNGSTNSAGAVQGDDDKDGRPFASDDEILAWENEEDFGSSEDDRKPAAKPRHLTVSVQEMMQDNKLAAKSPLAARPAFNVDVESSSDEGEVLWEEGDVGAGTMGTTETASQNPAIEHKSAFAFGSDAPFGATTDRSDKQVPRSIEKGKTVGNSLAPKVSFGFSVTFLSKPKLDDVRLASESTVDTSGISELLKAESSHGSMMRNTFTEPSSKSPVSDWDKIHQSSQTDEVLERAQAAASSMADWAGRAFRRAMKEANLDKQQQKQSSPPAKTNNKPAAADSFENALGVEETEITSLLSPRKVNDTGTAVSPPVVLKLPPQPIVVDQEPTPTRTAIPEFLREPTSQRERLDVSELVDQWEAERQQRERDGDTVTDEMKEEAIRLLKLFGVPFVEAPAEAEAQCAALEALGLVDGIVTEDSDVFVFGGKKIYKNIFDEKLYAEAYMADAAEKEMGLDRNAMVALALLLGSDYTRGVRGVGIVNAMELLQAFEVSVDLKKGLTRFAKWTDGLDLPITAGMEEEKAVKDFHEKHKSARNRWILPPNFPSDNVIHAYTNPVVDTSKAKFSWGTPDVEGLVVFAAKHMGMPAEETRKMLGPVLGRKGEKYRQTRLDSFMKYEDGIKFANVRSKRLRAVLGIEGKTEGQSHKKGKKSSQL